MGKPASAIFGVDTFNNQFNSLKDRSGSTIKDLGSKMIGQVDTLADKQKSVIDSQTPKLPLFDSMPLCAKNKVMEEGSQKFSG